MNAVKSALPDLKQVLEGVDPPYKSAAFDRLFEVVLQEARGTPSGKAHTLVAGFNPEVVAAMNGPARFEQFLKHYSITGAALSKVVDFESGQILSRNLGQSKTEKTRAIAALLALLNARKTGGFTVSRDELVKVCEEHDTFDRPNFARHMAGAEHDGSKVFILDESGVYRVSVPGEAFVAEVVRAVQPPPAV
jgi:hypothetical protein